MRILHEICHQPGVRVREADIVVVADKCTLTVEIEVVGDVP